MSVMTLTLTVTLTLTLSEGLLMCSMHIHHYGPLCTGLLVGHKCYLNNTQSSLPDLNNT